MKKAATKLLLATVIIQTSSYLYAINECDKLAAHPANTDNPTNVKGVYWETLNAQAAITACKKALIFDSKNARFLYQLGRAYNKADNQSQAFNYYKKSADLDYPPAIHQLADYYSDGSAVEMSEIKKFDKTGVRTK